ncbi:MAG: diadenylate cyclase CdaA [Clostridia bacterium]|nr:diadenylate cyclase CdaA [Clostridia bacterium]MBQ6613933.1 diadenylate cyclase CdaA [Clostridia bacterium]
MQVFFDFLKEFFTRQGRQFATMGVVDILDIVVLATVLYYVYRFVRERRAGKLAVGLGTLVILYAFTVIVGMNATSFILQNIFQVGLLALVILFQPELRTALEKVGADPFRNFKNITAPKDIAERSRVIENVCLAAGDMSRDRTGALIVIEKDTRLGDIIKTGVPIDALVSQSLIKNIFFNKAALHDGAVIISENRIAAAGCFLPLTNSKLPEEKGTRHRAGVGMSEASDALVVIVSEETGEISLAKDGKLIGQQNYTTLKKILTDELLGETQPKKNKKKKTSKKGTKEGENENN